ncbi:MAG: GGDEF domain-containing protein [Terracidiphilus sp.]
MMNWSELPDLAAIALLTCAFASVVRRNYTPASGLWLVGWVMIALHFAAFLFLFAPGNWGLLAELTGTVALVLAGLLFQSAVIPYWKERSSRWMLAQLMASNALYVILLLIDHVPHWALNAAAALIGIGPLAITLTVLRRFHHALRWSTVAIYLALSAFLLIFQNRPENGTNLALNAVLFVVFLGCSFNFFFAFRRATAGAFVTITGFMAWASVFCVGPWMQIYLPQIHPESEVWNLPKFVVAVGMIVLLLEDQIEHNKHLALHDELTGLPNRRLYQDRMSSALDRARRSGSQMALLVVDLNHFKQVNDSYGHHIGDLLLQHVGTTFSGRVRRSDTLARTGGDEFSLILEEPTSRADAMHVSQSLLELLKEPIELEGNLVRTGASIGVAVYPEDASDMESLCIAADLRMYEAKKGLATQGKKKAAQIADPQPR